MLLLSTGLCSFKRCYCSSLVLPLFLIIEGMMIFWHKFRSLERILVLKQFVVGWLFVMNSTNTTSWCSPWCINLSWTPFHALIWRCNWFGEGYWSFVFNFIWMKITSVLLHCLCLKASLILMLCWCSYSWFSKTCCDTIYHKLYQLVFYCSLLYYIWCQKLYQYVKFCLTWYHIDCQI